jgi:DNA-binding NtrC family response regulator
LADHFLRNCKSLNGTTKFFASEVLRLLEEYEWPGNVRELANFVERSFHLSGTSKEINPNHLPAHLISGKIVDRVVNREKGRLVDPSGFPSGGLPRLKEVEESTIMQILSDSRFNMSATARILGIGRSTLYRKLKKYNVVPRL